jgi:hypothetical protein
MTSSSFSDQIRAAAGRPATVPTSERERPVADLGGGRGGGAVDRRAPTTSGMDEKIRAAVRLSRTLTLSGGVAFVSDLDDLLR